MIQADWITGMWSAADSFFGHSAYLIVAIWLTREDTGKPGFVGFFFGFTQETLQRLQESAYLFESEAILAAAPLMQVQRADLGHWGVKWAPHGVLDRGTKVRLWSGLCVLLTSALLTAAPNLPEPGPKTSGREVQHLNYVQQDLKVNF